MKLEIAKLYFKAFIVYQSNFWFTVMAIMGLVGIEKIFTDISGWITVFVPIYYAVGVIVLIFVITDWKWKQLGNILKQLKESKKAKHD